MPTWVTERGVLIKRWGVALLLILATAQQAVSQDDFSGIWEASHLFCQIVADVKQEGQSLSGVVIIHQLAGEDDIYHFTGTLMGTSVQATHTDGHAFRGKITSPGKIMGTLTTTTGLRIGLELLRHRTSIQNSLKGPGDAWKDGES